jgi:hypothetical protein
VAEETIGNRQFVLYFMNDKFKLELKANSPDQCREWISILEAKRQLHNLDKLTAVNPNDFKTKTFKSLLKMTEVEQVMLLLLCVLHNYAI